MDITITLTAPEWMGSAPITFERLDNINNTIQLIDDETGLEYGMVCENNRDNFLDCRSLDFVITDIDTQCVSDAIDLVHGLIFEEFDVEFE